MARTDDKKVLRLGVVTLVVLALVSVATFNLSKFPGFRGTTYYAELSDASGLHKGNIVQIGGIRVGRVTGLDLEGEKVVVTFEVDGGVEFGPDSTASVDVLNLLGEKYLKVTPDAGGQLEAGGTIPVANTTSAYDIVGVFSDLTETTEGIDTDKLTEALDVVADTLDAAAPEVQGAFAGIARLSQTIASRDEELQTLFESSAQVSEVLAARSDDIVGLMRNSDLVFKELQKRRQAVYALLVNARILARQLEGVATDNARTIGPALAQVDDLTTLLVQRKKDLKATLRELGPYVSILSNIVGTGPWFDAYAANVLGVVTGEFEIAEGQF
ncbi:MCE family protein [Nocardioides sp. YIM 152588]|uniref:MCE family protein n=1 Tax=Nocardioides sp. YIM 152588 TaxID=3158259 RepID=UPI0032E50A09